MEKELNFEAHDLPIYNVLFSNYKYKIPRYQRPYSWNEDQISEFWNDLTKSEEPYFIGSFIFNHEDLETTGYIDVIDGQQRILTITIFMAVIRDLAKEIDTELSERIQTQDIAIIDRQGNALFRVLSGESTKEYFEKHIQSNSGTIFSSVPKDKEEKMIKNNYLYIHEKIEDELNKIETNQEKKKYLERIREKLSNLIVINIKISNEENAYEIFETTNARGVDLNIADLLKNLIFKNIPIDKTYQDFVKEIWLEIVNNVQLTGYELNKFIRYFWISRYSFVTEKKLYREIKRKITSWKSFLDDLWTASDWFNVLLKGEQTDWKNKNIIHWEKIHKSISAINYMGVTQCHVFFLSLFRNYEKLHTDPTWIIELIEKFTFNYSAICKQPGNRIERLYARYAKKLQEIIESDLSDKLKSKNIQTLFNELASELREQRPSREYFIESFMEIKYKNSEIGRSVVKYILSEVNNHSTLTNELKIDFINVNIEHILPQNPTPEWKLSKKDIKEYVDCLGNLTLIDKKINSRIGNEIIEKKIDELKKSKLEITCELVHTLEKNDLTWNRNLINERQRELAVKAYDEIWNY